MAYDYYSRCCICDTVLQTNNPKTYFCSTCYREWEDDILAKKAWVTFCINSEQANRHYGVYERDSKEHRIIFLRGFGSDFDVVKTIQGYRVIKTRYHQKVWK